jgi:6,7-dimethyl-8-ribityllumazine synthase
MPQATEGDFVYRGGRFALIVARFNDTITGRMLEGALDTLRRSGVDMDKDVEVFWVPGAFELPIAAQRVARTGRFQAIVALGCVIRGGTPHFDYVAGQAASGLTSVSLSANLPVCFGVLTTDNIEQALARSGTKMGNKGHEATISAIEMVNLLQAVDVSKERTNG